MNLQHAVRQPMRTDNVFRLAPAAIENAVAAVITSCASDANRPLNGVAPFESARTPRLRLTATKCQRPCYFDGRLRWSRFDCLDNVE